MEVVIAGALAFLGIPAGIIVGKMANEERVEINRLNLPLRRIAASFVIIISVYFSGFDFAHAIALLSLLLLFFEIPSWLIFSASPSLLLFGAAAATLSALFIYALILGMGVSSSRTVLRFAPFFAVLLLVCSL